MKEIFQKKRVFIGFITGGDGGIDYCVDCALALIDGGVDILEIGFPFSDPVADGPVIQQASQRALAQGSGSKMILEIARRLREKTSAPLVLFSYFNPLLQQGTGYLKELKQAGYNAVLIVDLPPHYEFFQKIKAAGLMPICVISPSTDDERMIEIEKISEGFLYYACRKGTTGMRDSLPADFGSQIARIRKKSKLPIAAGFGISNRETALAATQHADGFVVGSAFVKKMGEKVNPVELKILAQEILAN